MAFEQPNFAPIGANSSQSPRTFSYKTDVDNLSQVIGIGYFTDKQFQLNDGDFIYVIATDGQNIFRYQNVGAPMLEIVTTAATPQFPTIVSVTSASDFPVPSAGVITLASNTMYMVGGAVDIGSDRLEYSAGSELRGISSTTSSVTSTTTSALITCLDQVLRIGMIRLFNPNGPLFNFRGGPAFAVIIDQVVSFSYGSLGTFDDVNALLLTLCGFTASAPGMLFTGTGTISGILITNTLFANYTGAAIDLGTAVFDTVQIINNNYEGAVSSTPITGAAASANITTRGVITGNVFDVALTVLEVSDLKYKYSGNTVVPDSKASIGASVSGNVAVTSVVTVNTPLKVNVGTGAVAYTLERYTIATNGTITYIGLEGITETVAYTAFADNATGNNKVFSFYVAKNGSIIPGSKATASFDTTNPQNIGLCHALVELSTGDTVDLFVENTTDDTDITVIDISGTID